MKKTTTKYIAGLFTFFIVIFVLLSSCGESAKEKKFKQTLPKIDLSFIKDKESKIISRKAIELDKKFSRLQKLTGFNGAVLYAEKGRLIFKKAYGFKDVKNSRGELSTKDVFQLASVSKMFSATCVMILKNEGKLDYDQDIRKYLPKFPYEGITVRLLMTHRSGLPRYMSLALDEWDNKSKPMTNNDVIDLFVKYHPDKYFTPDNGFHYCNTNYALLANIVEAISGEHFEDFIEDRIFKPLDMDSSFVYNLRGKTEVSTYVEKGVPGFYRRGWRWREMENDYLNGVMGDKNVYTSVEDFYKFDKSMDNFTLLPKEILEEAFSPGSPKYRKRKDNYGFGWRIKSSLDSTVYHFGWWKGFRTFYIRDMKHQKTLIVLTNKDKGPGSANFWDIIEADTLPLGLRSDMKKVKK